MTLPRPKKRLVKSRKRGELAKSEIRGTRGASAVAKPRKESEGGALRGEMGRNARRATVRAGGVGRAHNLKNKGEAKRPARDKRARAIGRVKLRKEDALGHEEGEPPRPGATANASETEGASPGNKNEREEVEKSNGGASGGKLSPIGAER